MARAKSEARQIIKRVKDYDNFKSLIAKKGLTMQVEESEKYYLLKAIEGRRVWVHTVWKSSYLAGRQVAGVSPTQELANQSDFESDHKAAAETDPPTMEVNRDGKLFVHQTPTPIGATSYVTSEGDDYSNRSSVGGGQKLAVNHVSGGGDNVVDIDFNCAGNKTWIYSGFASWKDTQQDTMSLSVLTRKSTTSSSSGTNYSTLNYPGHPWDGKLILPAAGDGDLAVTVPVLVGFYPGASNNKENDVPCYWNATWNPATKQYDSITPAPAGDGEFNMFTDEITLFRFVNNIIFDGTNSYPWSMDSRDSQQLGDGMFIRLTPITNTASGDHNWSACVSLFMHRENTC